MIEKFALRSLGGLLMGVLFYLLGCYFLYTVASFHNLLRRMNKNSSMIVASVSQGIDTISYLYRCTCYMIVVPQSFDIRLLRVIQPLIISSNL